MSRILASAGSLVLILMFGAISAFAEIQVGDRVRYLDLEESRIYSDSPLRRGRVISTERIADQVIYEVELDALSAPFGEPKIVKGLAFKFQVLLSAENRTNCHPENKLKVLNSFDPAFLLNLSDILKKSTLTGTEHIKKIKIDKFTTGNTSYLIELLGDDATKFTDAAITLSKQPEFKKTSLSQYSNFYRSSMEGIIDQILRLSEEEPNSPELLPLLLESGLDPILELYLKHLNHHKRGMALNLTTTEDYRIYRGMVFCSPKERDEVIRSALSHGLVSSTYLKPGAPRQTHLPFHLDPKGLLGSHFISGTLSKEEADSYAFNGQAMRSSACPNGYYGVVFSIQLKAGRGFDMRLTQEHRALTKAEIDVPLFIHAHEIEGYTLDPSLDAQFIENRNFDPHL